MLNFNQSLSWHEALPKSFNWLKALPCKKTNTHMPGAHHLVLLQRDPEKPQNYTIDAPLLPQELKGQLLEGAQTLGLKSNGGVYTLTIDKIPYLLVFANSLPVSARQRGVQAGIDAANYGKNLRIKELVICRGEELSSLAMLEGLALGYYELQAFKGQERKEELLPEKIFLWDEQLKERDIGKTLALAEAITITRTLEDAPANWLHPGAFAEIAKEIAKEANISCEIKEREEIKSMGMGAFTSVGQASPHGSKLITLKIAGKQTDKTIVLVGKGLTFDAGGVCLKPSAGLEEMKYDMCGGAAVLGAAYFLGKVKPPVNVVCLIGAVENLIGEQATRPGDVVRALNGKTIEVINTDAEGRLVLADLLVYAQQNWQPQLTIDVATLTGAVLIALGSCGAGVMSNHQKAADFICKAGQEVGEPLWQLPIWPEIAKEIKSDVADLKNIAAPHVKAGTLVAAAFLREFVGTAPWVHIDIAATAWNCKATGNVARGGSGFIVKTLLQTCLHFDEAHW